jgi:4-hydroxybenzoate polyprenyltransferase
VTQTMLGFVAFCLCASSVYLLNDALDLESDRHHPHKRFRALASGAIQISHALLLIPVLLALAFGLALYVSPYFALVLLLYYVLTLAYSARLKRVTIVDILSLAGLYTLRIVAGAAILSEIPSFWLLAVSMFIFFSLAIVKRYSELQLMHRLAKDTVRGRNYQVVDCETLISLGVSSGHASVLVLALYINSVEVTQQYLYPHTLWLLCPLLMYWMARLWLITRRGEMHDDPLVYTVKDWRSRLVGILIAIVVVLAAG